VTEVLTEGRAELVPVLVVVWPAESVAEAGVLFGAAAVVVVEVLVVAGANGSLARKLAVTVSVPLYRGHPGILFGGARPPPQSTGLQISSEPGT
jgi:hypothetical protein